MAPAATERFHATNGLVSGYVALAVMAGVLVLAVLPWDAGRPLGVAILAVLGLLLVWCVMLRPAMWATERMLVLRGIFHTDEIPLGAIEQVAVSQVVAVKVRDKRYTSPAVGYTARQKIKANRRRVRGGDEFQPTAANTYQVYVEERIAQLAREGRERFGPSDAPVRRTWAWAEIAGCVALTAAWLIWLLVF